MVPPNGTILSFLDRLFYSTGFSKALKVGAAVVSCRRGGNTASFDVLNKYFTISGMPVASSTYWNQVHGFLCCRREEGLEGLQTHAEPSRNMTFLDPGHLRREGSRRSARRGAQLLHQLPRREVKTRPV